MDSKVDRRVHEVFVLDGVGQRVQFEPHVNLPNFTLQAITGTVQSASVAGYRSLADPAINSDANSRTFGEMINWTGEWLGLYSNSFNRQNRSSVTTFMISADYFGFGKIHYAIVPSQSYPGLRTLIAGPTFRGVTKVLGDMGIKSSISWDVALPHVVSHVNLFRTRASRRTFSDLIEVLGSTEVLVASEHGVSVMPRPTAKFEQDYDGLIRAGIDAAISDASSASKLNMPMSFSLSGGKDSRALLSMLLAGGKASEWNIVTKRPSASASASSEIFHKDLYYASTLVDKFNLNWHTPQEGHYVEVDFHEFLNDYQDFRSNQNFELTPVQHLRRNASEVTTMGIGGELLRSYIARGYRDGHPSWWQDAGKSPETAHDDLRSLFTRLVIPWNLPQDFYEQAAGSFADSMMFDITGDSLDHIDKSYGEYRSRAFSANLESNRHSGSFLTYPLARPEFVAASRLLSPEDRDDGRILFDIIEQCSANLNTLNFAAPPWPQRFLSKGDSTFWDNSSVPRAEIRYQSTLANARKIPFIRRDVRRENLRDLSIEHIGNRLEMLRDLNTSGFMDALVSRAARRSLMSSGSSNSLLAVVESIADVVSEPSIAITKLCINIRDNTTTTMTEDIAIPLDRNNKNKSGIYSLKIRDDSSTLFAEYSKSIDLVNVTATIETDPDTLLSFVQMHALPDECEVAIYVFSMGVRLERSIYRSSHRILISSADPSTPIDRVTVFLRWTGDPEALRVFDIAPHN